jgi:tRNA threonylcarbamoyladenosine biosynthesis protein TsaB
VSEQDASLSTNPRKDGTRRLSLLLALEGALGAFSAAAIQDERDPGRAASGAGNDALERGLALVAEVLNGRPPADVTMLAVTVGPGSFTGLRIAVSYAKSLAFALGVPLCGVSSYDVVERDDSETPRAAFVSGRAGLVCARLTTPLETFITCGADEAVAGALAERLGGGATLLCAGAWEGVVSHLGERGVIVRFSPPMEMPPALALARKALRRTPATNPHAIRTDYGSVDYYSKPKSTKRV